MRRIHRVAVVMAVSACCTPDPSYTLMGMDVHDHDGCGPTINVLAQWTGYYLMRYEREYGVPVGDALGALESIALHFDEQIDGYHGYLVPDDMEVHLACRNEGLTYTPYVHELGHLLYSRSIRNRGRTIDRWDSNHEDIVWWRDIGKMHVESCILHDSKGE